MSQEIAHFFIRAASHIESKTEALRSNLRTISIWKQRAEEELQEINALRAQILTVAQTLDGQDINPHKMEDALGCTSDTDREVFEAALNYATIARIQNEVAPGVLTVKSSDLPPEAVAAIKNFFEAHKYEPYHSIKIVNTSKAET